MWRPFSLVTPADTHRRLHETGIKLPRTAAVQLKSRKGMVSLVEWEIEALCDLAPQSFLDVRPGCAVCGRVPKSLGRIVVRSDTIPEHVAVFRPREAPAFVLATAEFRDAVETQRLSGLIFEEVETDLDGSPLPSDSTWLSRQLDSNKLVSESIRKQMQTYLAGGRAGQRAQRMTVRDSRLLRADVAGLGDADYFWALTEPAWDDDTAGTEGQQVLARVTYFLRDAANGGLSQALSNRDATEIAQIIADFERLGVADQTALLREAQRIVVSGDASPLDLDKRGGRIDAQNEDWVEEQLASLNDQLIDEVDLWPHFRQFVESNPGQFFRDE